jgi:spore maturation protein SpmA
MNAIFIALIVGAVVTAAFGGNMPEVSQAGIDSAKRAVEIAIGLLGMMALWLGFMRVLQDAGVMRSIARRLAPVMRRLFPDVPAEHPAMGAMVMNIAANILGLGNAATPFGLKAMQELNRLNPHKGVATNSMVLFLAINTSGVAVLPLGVIAIRASLGAENTAGIIAPTMLATFCSTVAAILVAKALAGRSYFALERYTEERRPEEEDPASSATDAVRSLAETEPIDGPNPPASRTRTWFLGLIAVALVGALYLQVGRDPATGWDQAREILSSWLLPVLMAFIVLFGFAHRARVYESLVKGAREGFDIFVMIIPFLVAILVAVGMFRASGALDWLIAAVQPVTSLIGFPAEALPMALVRPLSGSGAMGVMTETMTQYGPDSFTGFLVSVMNGSTETTFYVLALYMGSIHARAARHAVIACLAADAVGMGAALLWSRLFF